MTVQNLTILLVEDDENDIFLMERAFKKAHLANPLQIVRDGEEAIDYLNGEGIYQNREKFPYPFLVLLDLKMPKKSGFEVLEWIRSSPATKDLLVVVLTDSNEQPHIQKAYELGANSYLLKPAQFQDLVALMLRLQGYWLLVDKKPEQSALPV